MEMLLSPCKLLSDSFSVNIYLVRLEDIII